MSNPTKTMPSEYTDAGNAMLFAANYHDNLKLIDGKWHICDGKNWTRDDEAASALAQKMSLAMLTAATEMMDTVTDSMPEDERRAIERYYKFALASRSAAHIGAIIKLSRALLKEHGKK